MHPNVRPPDWQGPLLFVEGIDDKHVIDHLLTAHGLQFGKPEQFPFMSVEGGLEPVLKAFRTAVKASAGGIVGLVIDADSPLAIRWERIRGILGSLGATISVQPPADGFIHFLTDYQCRAGIWLMPDNQHDGKLETFLRDLIAQGDSLIPHAQDSTRQAKDRLQAAFTEPDFEKAVLHAWLAWQQAPGRPFGTAITARFFSHDTPAALRFVSWFKTLYNI